MRNKPIIGTAFVLALQIASPAAAVPLDFMSDPSCAISVRHTVKPGERLIFATPDCERAANGTPSSDPAAVPSAPGANGPSLFERFMAFLSGRAPATYAVFGEEREGPNHPAPYTAPIRPSTPGGVEQAALSCKVGTQALGGKTAIGITVEAREAVAIKSFLASADGVMPHAYEFSPNSPIGIRKGERKAVGIRKTIIERGAVLSGSVMTEDGRRFGCATDM